jgi:hypothetical protein
MKKKVLLTLAIILGLAAAFGAGAYAATKYTLLINGKKVDADVRVINGTTYLPLRTIGTLLGAKVGYNASTHTITVDTGTTQQIKIPAGVTSYTAGDFVFFDLIVKQDEFGGWDVSVEVGNNGTTTVEGAVFTAIFYDADENRVGTAQGSVHDLKPGETKVIDLVTFDDLTGYTKVKFQVDSQF